MDYKYDETKGLLTVYGDMEDYLGDYSDGRKPPYNSNENELTVLTDKIGNNAFKKHYNLVKANTFFVSYFGDNCFFLCTSLKEVGFVVAEEIGKGSFSYCNSLVRVNLVLSGKLKTIGDNAFFGCESLEDVTFPLASDQLRIGTLAFSCCNSLQSVEIPEGVIEIGDCAFFNCQFLQKVTIPKTVKKIGLGAFDGCSPFLKVTNNSNCAIKHLSSTEKNYLMERVEFLKKYAEKEMAKKEPIRGVKINPASNDTKYMPVMSTGVSMNDIIGLDDAKDELIDTVILPMKRPDLYKKFEKKTGGGILLYGLPGTGKTMFAQAVATEINGAFFSIKCSDLLSSLVGSTEGNIRSLFQTAREYPCSVIFFDEFESIGLKRGTGYNTDIYDKIVSELLSQIQGFEKYENTMLLMAATNRPWDLDPALLRPGRFNRKIYIPLPDFDARKGIIEKELGKIPVSDDIDYVDIANHTDGFNCADVVELCEQMKMNAIRRCALNNDQEIITAEDVKKAKKKVTSSVVSSDMDKFIRFKEENC